MRPPTLSEALARATTEILAECERIAASRRTEPMTDAEIEAWAKRLAADVANAND